MKFKIQKEKLRIVWPWGLSSWNVMKSIAQRSRILARYQKDHPKMIIRLEVDRKTVSKIPG